MKRHQRNRLILLLLTWAMVVVPLGVHADAARTTPCVGWPYRVKPVTRPEVRVRRMKRLTRCVFTEVGIPAQIPTALFIQERESGFWPWAKNPDVAGACRAANPYGSCGSFQHLARYWPGRVVTYLPRRGFPHWPHVSPLNPLANAIVTARMVKAAGWGPWA